MTSFQDAKEVDVAVADGKQSSGGSSIGKGGCPQSEPSASSERARVSFQNKIPKVSLPPDLAGVLSVSSSISV